MPITNLSKKKLKEISFFDLSQKAKKRKVWIFQSKMHLLADWLLWKIAKIGGKAKAFKNYLKSTLSYTMAGIYNFFPGSIAF